MPKPRISLRERALGYLTRREYSRSELQRKLAPHAGEEDLDALLDEFQRRGWLSDARYADQIVHARRGKVGSLKVAHELRAQGVAEELVNGAVKGMQAEDETSALAVWRKKFGTPAATREEWAKQARFLQSRGFSTEIIRKVLRGSEADTDD